MNRPDLGARTTNVEPLRGLSRTSIGALKLLPINARRYRGRDSYFIDLAFLQTFDLSEVSSIFDNFTLDEYSKSSTIFHSNDRGSLMQSCTRFGLLLFVNILCSVSFAQNNAVIDTIIFKSIPFQSNLEKILNECVQDTIQAEPLTRKKVVYLQRILQKELKTRAFKKIRVITGKSIKMPDTGSWMRLMEWHFESDKDATKAESALNRLKGGEIRWTIIPNACRWIRSDRKIYVVQYRPRLDGNLPVDALMDCINKIKN